MMKFISNFALALMVSMSAAIASAQQPTLTNDNQSTAIGGQFSDGQSSSSGYGIGGAVTSSENHLITIYSSSAESTETALENVCKDGKPVAPFNGTLMYVCKDGDLDVESPTCKPVMIDVTCMDFEEFDTEYLRAAVRTPYLLAKSTASRRTFGAWGLVVYAIWKQCIDY